MNKYTALIHSKGWTVVDACKRWKMRYETYNKHCNDIKYQGRLEDLCKGLDDKLSA